MFKIDPGEISRAAPCAGPRTNPRGPPRFCPRGRFKTKASTSLRASQEKCYNLICPKMLLFAGNFDPALRLRVQ